MVQIFGFEITRPSQANNSSKEQQNQVEPTQKTFSLPQNDDGAVTIQSGAYYGTYVDLDGVVRNEIELVTRYREMSMQPELETAIDEIVNDSIVQDDAGQSIEINTDELEQPESIKKKIQEEFENVLRLLNFGNMGHDIFRRWYIDGRLFYHVVIDESAPALGIQEVRYIDPRRIRKIREIQKMKDPKSGMEIIKKQNEYYLYNERGVIGAHSNMGTRIAVDSIVNINSGLMDAKRAMVLSYLHKAIKPLNQLRMIEDATVIYRLSRAPERRIFYIDVGNMPTIKAEQYLRDIMVKYRNKLVYDSSTGEIKDDRKHLCLDMETKVPLLDGRTLTLNEIAKEYKDKPIWVYSTDPKTGKFAPGLVTWAGVSRPNAEVMKLTFDNGKTVICTPDHKFPVWENGLIQAKNLKVGDSIIPLYRRKENITPGAKKSKDYEQIWENDKKTWSFTHRLVSQWKDEVQISNDFVFNEHFADSPKNCVHHKNINRFDNTPENIVKEFSDTSYSEMKEQARYRNHKVTKIEYLNERMDTGCLTIDGDEIYHSYHTFGLDAGVYTQNSMLEDFWLPRREGGKGTEITTLPGGQNLGELEDVKYFEKKLYKSLGVPLSRLEQNNGFSLGRTTEITRDELKFAKFVMRLRNKFSTIFDDLLRIQLVLKRICTDEEWREFKEKIWYDFKKDNNFNELKEAELLGNRLSLLQVVDPFVGKYYSMEWVRKNVLHLTDEDIEEIDEQIANEADKMVEQQQALGLDPNTGQPMQSAGMQQSQQNQMELEQGQSTEDMTPKPNNKFVTKPNELDFV